MHKVITRIDHDQLVPFLKSHLKLKSGWGALYWLFNIMLIGYAIYYGLRMGASGDTVISGLGLGFALFFLLLPLHEGLHAIAYKLVGAPKVSFGGDWRKGIAYAVADKFVVGYRSFLFVALTPFVVINGLLIIAFVTISAINPLILLGTLILHTAGCFGDFALVSFMHGYRHMNITTMDDMEEKATYFFVDN